MKPSDDRSLRWLMQRVRRLGPGEVAHRVSAMRWWTRVEPLRPLPPSWRSAPQRTARWLRVPAGADASPLVARAERVLAGDWPGFGGHWHRREQPLQWNLDTASGHCFSSPRADRLVYRPASQSGDIRAVWEVQRQHACLWLAQAWAVTRDPRFLDCFADLMISFMDQCPFPRGAAWVSPLEVAVRTVNWAASWELLAEAPLPERLRERWRETGLRGMELIRANLSVGSSANNHLIGELVGLCVGLVTWTSESVDDVMRRLDGEVLRQIAPDGSSREGSPGYLAFSLGGAMLAGIVAQGARGALSTESWQRLAAGAGFLRGLSVGGRVPRLADSDDGQFLNLGPKWMSPAQMGSTACCLLGGRENEESVWWESVHSAPVVQVPQARTHYPDAALAWLSDDGELKAMMQGGAIGENALGAHGHADSLSVLLWHGKTPVLVDAGTGSYLADPKMRAALRGTSAHNTATVDQRDSSQASGAFQWAQRASVQLLELSPNRVRAQHDGFCRLSDPVVHEREIEVAGDELIVSDTFHCLGQHEVTVRWHLHPDFVVKPSSSGYALHAPALCGTIAFDLGRSRVVCGQESPRVGWISRRFSDWEPAPVLEHCVDISGTTTLRTVLRLTRIS